VARIHIDPGRSYERVLPQLRQRLRDAPREIASLEAQIAANGPNGESLRTQLAGLRAEREALEHQIETTESYLSELQNRVADLSTERSLLELNVLLETLWGERNAIESQLVQARSDMGEARDQLSRLDRERARLDREMAIAQSAHASVAGLEQLVEFVTDLAPGGTRVINAASVPVIPSGPSRLLIAALAVVLGGMLATLFVFLREAVREPA
jgi:uncharacterized protein involved in exopolysaccharide biosynthesis